MAVNLLAKSKCVNNIALVDVWVDRVRETGIRVYQMLAWKDILTTLTHLTYLLSNLLL